MPYLLLTLALMGMSTCRLTGPDDLNTVGDSLIVRSGSSFGECMGYCRTELELVDARAVLVQRGTSPQQFPDRMVERSIPDSVVSSVEAYLDIGWFFKLADEYGCPDCADGGAEWIEVQDGDRTKRVTFEFGQAPPGLDELASRLRAFRDALIGEFG